MGMRALVAFVYLTWLEVFDFERLDQTHGLICFEATSNPHQTKGNGLLGSWVYHIVENVVACLS